MKKLTHRLLNLRTVWVLLTFAASLGFATHGYGQAVVSLAATEGDTLTVGEQIEVSVTVANGAGVAGYALLLAFDAAVLRYVNATPGDYLPPGGVWMAPQLRADGSYEVALSVGDETSSGKTVQFAEEELSVQDMLFNLPGQPAAVEDPYAVSVLASSVPEAAEATDGTLVTFTFEVIAAKSTTLSLVENLSDVEDVPLAVIAQSQTLSLNASAAPVDVNGDGTVNILDLVFVAGHFGASVTAANKAADVNGDDAINILDLTLIAQNFGK